MRVTPSVPSPFAVLQAKQRAWLINLLTVIVEAYDLGAVLGPGVVLETEEGQLRPDVAYIPNTDRGRVKADAIRGAAPLAIDVLHSRVPEIERAKLRQRYAAAQVLEYWQVDADRGQATCYQATADWRYEPIPPDVRGIYYSAAIVHLAFPMDWFRKQPGLLTLLEWWGLIERDDAQA